MSVEFPNREKSQFWQPGPWTFLMVMLALGCAGWMIFWYAPEEVTMGAAQRIVYLHVSVAWCGLAGCLGMGGSSAAYLLTRRPGWDASAQAAGEVGWLGSTLTLLTGSLWAHEAWNVWWTWEPRLTSSLILWLIFAGYFLIRSAIDEPRRRALAAAVVALLALADVPLVILATRWFRGIHPVAPEMDERMRLTLLITVVSISWLWCWLAWQRRQQLVGAARLAMVERRRELVWEDAG